jgi:hypothetical protein
VQAHRTHEQIILFFMSRFLHRRAHGVENCTDGDGPRPGHYPPAGHVCCFCRCTARRSPDAGWGQSALDGQLGAVGKTNVVRPGAYTHLQLRFVPLSCALSCSIMASY